MEIWFTGLSGSGKTTLAKLLKDSLKDQSVLTVDGDQIRNTIHCDLDFSSANIIQNNRKIIENEASDSLKKYKYLSIFE